MVTSNHIHLLVVGDKDQEVIPIREDQWTETIAVGRMEFVNEIGDDLGSRALGKSIVSDGEQHQLRDAQDPYKGHFDAQKVHLRPNNSFEWDDY